MNMLHSKIDMNLYLVMATIYQQGSITKAAEKLHLTQPAISHALSRLREKYDDPLFVRHGRKMQATEKCLAMIPFVEEGLAQLNKTFHHNLHFDIATQTRKVNLGLRDILEALFFPSLLQLLLRDAPGLKLHSRQAGLKGYYEDLSQGDIDLVVDAQFAIDKNVKSIKLGENPFMLVCRKGHPIQSNLSLQSYLRYQHIVASLKPNDINIVDNALSGIQHSRDIVLRCENFFAAIQVLMRTDLIMTMPLAAARQFELEFPITILPLPFELPSIPVQLYWPVNQDQDPVNLWLRKQIRTIGAELLQK